MPTKKEDLPSTIARSPKNVQRTYSETLDSAHEQYDSEERAHRTAFAAVKHVAEKRGDNPRGGAPAPAAGAGEGRAPGRRGRADPLGRASAGRPSRRRPRRGLRQ